MMRTSATATELYLDLMKRSLTGLVTEDAAKTPGLDALEGFDPERRWSGEDWPATALTMIGMERLTNLQECLEDVISRGVAGDVIETGVWRGGATIFMRAVLAAHGERGRVVWVADSFQGVPRPDTSAYPADEGDTFWEKSELAVSLDDVRGNFESYGLLDEQVRFLPGWFRETLGEAPIEQLAVLRLDGDLYESTIVALRALYPKLSAGGYVIVDDYALDTCRLAVDDYRVEAGVLEEPEWIDRNGAFWRKS
jgi:hypothetical protein